MLQLWAGLFIFLVLLLNTFINRWSWSVPGLGKFCLLKIFGFLCNLVWILRPLFLQTCSLVCSNGWAVRHGHGTPVSGPQPQQPQPLGHHSGKLSLVSTEQAPPKIQSDAHLAVTLFLSKGHPWIFKHIKRSVKVYIGKNLSFGSGSRHFAGSGVGSGSRVLLNTDPDCC